MIKINTNKSRVGLICHKSPYSIIKKDEDKIYYLMVIMS